MSEFVMPRLHVGDGWQAGAATLFPVWTEAATPGGLAVGAHAVQVLERDGHPVVGELVLRNRSGRSALLLEGELLEGGWQHRILNTDVLLEPGQAWVAEVSCVEQGRWSGTAGHRRRARVASGSVRRDLRRPAGVRQREVWTRVARLESRLGATATSVRTAGYLARDFAAACRQLTLTPLAPAGSGTALAAQHGPLQARGAAATDGTVLHALVLDLRHDTGADA